MVANKLFLGGVFVILSHIVIFNSIILCVVLMQIMIVANLMSLCAWSAMSLFWAIKPNVTIFWQEIHLSMPTACQLLCILPEILECCPPHPSSFCLYPIPKHLPGFKIGEKNLDVSTKQIHPNLPVKVYPNGAQTPLNRFQLVSRTVLSSTTITSLAPDKGIHVNVLGTMTENSLATNWDMDSLVSGERGEKIKKQKNVRSGAYGWTSFIFTCQNLICKLCTTQKLFGYVFYFWECKISSEICTTPSKLVFMSNEFNIFSELILPFSWQYWISTYVQCYLTLLADQFVCQHGLLPKSSAASPSPFGYLPAAPSAKLNIVSCLSPDGSFNSDKYM